MRGIPSTRAAGRLLLCLALVWSFALPAAAQSSASITIQPDCGPSSTDQPDEAPYEIAVQGNGFEPNGDVEINFAGERQDDPQQRDVVADENGSFSTVIRPARRPAGTYEVEALQRNGQEGAVTSRSTAPFTVPCPEPQPEPTAEPTGEPTAQPSPTESGLPPRPRSTPRDDKDKKGKKGKRSGFKPSLEFGSAVAPPGSVVELSGRGFPRKKILLLDWNQGIGSMRVQTNGRGRFSVGVLIFPNDVVGPRRLVVTGRRVRTSSTGFLVVPSTAAPPDFVNR